MYGIFTYIYHKNQPDVGKYTSPMDAMGSDDLQEMRPSVLCMSSAPVDGGCQSCDCIGESVGSPYDSWEFKVPPQCHPLIRPS